MPLVNKVREMRNQGLNEPEIIQRLREEGYSPLETNQALEQEKIKSVIDQQQEMDTLTAQETTGMQPSLVNTEQTQMENPIEQQEQTQEYIYPAPSYPQYSGYQEYQPYSSAETITEIAESLIEEKINKLRKDILILQESKEILGKEIKNIDRRLKRIEEIIDKLQATIIGKIGSFYNNIEDIKQEMEMMQESFSKALNPLIDKARSKEEKEEKTEKKRKKLDGFEHYLRR